MKKFHLFCTVIFFFVTTLSFGSNLSEELASKIAQLSHEQTFAGFSLQLTGEEETSLAQLAINRRDYYDYYGMLPEKKDIAAFLQSLGNNLEIASNSAAIIEQKIEDIKEAFHAEAVWVSIRASHDLDEFNTPRWHTDGYMYSPYSGLQYKTAFILKGPGTLFCRLSDEGRKKFFVIHDEQSQILGQYIKEGRPWDEINAKMAEYEYKLAKLIQEHKESGEASIEQGGINHGAIFILGDHDDAAIHSEPHIDSDRLFVSVVTGTKEQIQEHYDNQKKHV